MVTVQTLTSIINQVLPEPHAGLLAGITFGTKAALSKQLYQNLITTGTLHIVALSGMNITIVASLVSLTLIRFLNRRVASLITILLIIGFVFFVGPEASIVRAAFMGIIALVALIFGKQRFALWAWGIAVTLMLIINFSWFFDISFQLSALATLGIILFAKKKKVSLPTSLSSRARSDGDAISAIGTYLIEIASSPAKPDTRNDKKGIIFFLWSLIEDDLRVTLAAQVFTIPIILLAFHRMSLISPLTNILIGWTIEPLTVLGWVIAGFGLLWLPLAQVVAWASWLVLQYVLIVIDLTSKIPLASVGW